MGVSTNECVLLGHGMLFSLRLKAEELIALYIYIATCVEERKLNVMQHLESHVAIA